MPTQPHAASPRACPSALAAAGSSCVRTAVSAAATPPRTPASAMLASAAVERTPRVSSPPRAPSSCRPSAQEGKHPSVRH